MKKVFAILTAVAMLSFMACQSSSTTEAQEQAEEVITEVQEGAAELAEVTEEAAANEAFGGDLTEEEMKEALGK